MDKRLDRIEQHHETELELEETLLREGLAPLRLVSPPCPDRLRMANRRAIQAMANEIRHGRQLEARSIFGLRITLPLAALVGLALALLLAGAALWAWLSATLPAPPPADPATVGIVLHPPAFPPCLQTRGGSPSQPGVVRIARGIQASPLTLEVIESPNRASSV